MEYLLQGAEKAPPTGNALVFGEPFPLSQDQPEILAALHKRISQFIWCTYRRGFARIGDTTYQSDSGWGCMLRCGQMILAEALQRARLTAPTQQQQQQQQQQPPQQQHTSSDDLEALRVQIITLLGDSPECPFSIQRIAMRGAIVDKPIGAWFGPNAAAQVIKSLVAEEPSVNLSVFVAMDGCLATRDVEDAVCPDGKWTKPLFLLIPLRLGLHSLHSEYFTSLRAMLQMPESVGAIGGRPNAAHYFIGTIDEDLLFLDPHTTQQSAPTGSILPTYSCSQACRMRVAAVDPSLCLGFVVRDEASWKALLYSCAQVMPKLFDIVERAPALDDHEDEFAVSDEDDDGFAIVGTP